MARFLQTTTPHLQTTLDFYQSLNFQHAFVEGMHFVGDGGLLIGINEARTSRLGLAIVGEDRDEIEKAMTPMSPIHKNEEGLMMADPSGVVTTVSANDLELPEFENQPSALGNAAGLTIETANMEGSLAYYEALGFETTMDKASDGWLAMKDKSGFGLSLLNIGMCPHLFFNPSVSFFNGKEGNPKIIQNLRDKGISFAEEITQFNKEGIVDNVIVRDPGGLGFFVFND